MHATEQTGRFVVVLILVAGTVGGMLWAGVVALPAAKAQTRG